MNQHDAATLRRAVRDLMPRAKADLAELVAIRSVADPDRYPAEECERAARWVATAFEREGLDGAELHATPDGGTAVVARRPAREGAPTVLLYCHYDVLPELDETAWRTPAWELTEKSGRWYGRGAADCKGNIVALLTALRGLRATGRAPAAGVTLVADGSKERGAGGLEDFVPRNADLLRADAVQLCDSGNFAIGIPTFTTALRGDAGLTVTVSTLNGPVRPARFGGPAPDALTALVRMLGGLHDARGDLAVAGIEAGQAWPGVAYPEERFRTDAGVLAGVGLAGSGTVADRLWARPAVTVLGIDAPPVNGTGDGAAGGAAAGAVQPSARARLDLRIPPDTDPDAAYDALAKHLEAAAPWHARVTVEKEAAGAPFSARTDGPAYAAMSDALEVSYGRKATTQGRGGTDPLCGVLAGTYPEAEIMMFGVEEPQCLVHAPNESVDPTEIEHIAFAEALFLAAYRG
ncbi:MULTISPECIES: dipeptidase [Actinomadura]|uniref:Dipeptidase n=1 Tax=Actinomadura yumaensis TaxID=111807 RepID=A0ABW2CHX7_9ACTN|nr:dipeptidase [Actinomadura sp. J1-007]